MTKEINKRALIMEAFFKKWKEGNPDLTPFLLTNISRRYREVFTPLPPGSWMGRMNYEDPKKLWVIDSLKGLSCEKEETPKHPQDNQAGPEAI